MTTKIIEIENLEDLLNDDYEKCKKVEKKENKTEVIGELDVRRK